MHTIYIIYIYGVGGSDRRGRGGSCARSPPGRRPVPLARGVEGRLGGGGGQGQSEEEELRPGSGTVGGGSGPSPSGAAGGCLNAGRGALGGREG